jgi:predicted Zn-dependent protease
MKRLLLLTVLLALAAGCSTVPITGRRQLSLVSDSEVLSSSLTQYREYMGQAKVSGNRAQSAQVERVGRRIADATERYLRANGLGKDVSNFSWEFNLVEDKEINAFCMPGGKIVVYTGLMALVGSDDELAVVLGHEVAHAVAKHSNERMSQQMVAQAGAAAVGYATQERSAMVQAAASGIYGLGAQYGALLPFSRKHESEADYMGLVLMTMAGYDPDAAPAFWRKMSANSGGKTPELLSSHPSDATRTAALQKAIPEVKAKYAPRP